MKELIKEIRNWKLGYFKYLKYSYKLTLELYRGRFTRVASVFKKRFGSIRRITLVAAGLIIGWLANHFGITALTEDVLNNYLVAVGAMIGGTIAIIYSISIFLLQGVADLYSSKHFEEYTNNWRDQLIYAVVIIIAVAFFGSGLFIGQLQDISVNISQQIVFWSLGLIGLVFALIDWQYEVVRKKISPSNAVSFLQNKGLKFIDELEKNANRIATIINLRDDKLTADMAKATVYNHILQPHINDLDRQLETLIEIALKLSDRQETETTKLTLTTVHNLLIRFFEARKTSSLVIPSQLALLAVESDSQSFLINNVERLNKAGNKFINENKDENATHVLNIYNSLATKAADISYIGKQRDDNPILEALVGYLGYLIDSGQRFKNIEVVYQGSRVLGDIAVLCVNKGFTPTLYGLQKKIMDVAVFGLTEKQNVIVDKCIHNYLRIIGESFGSDKLVRKHVFDDSLKNIAEISNYLFTLMKSGYLSDDFTNKMTLSKGYDEMWQLLVEIMNQYPKIKEDREKRRYVYDVIELFEEINTSLRRLSEKIKNCDNLLTESVGRLLFQINDLVIDLIGHEDFKGKKDQLIARLEWNMHLPYWFVNHSESFDGGSNNFRSLVESVAKTGILIAEKLGNKKMVKSCADCLYSIAEKSLERNTDKYGYDEPRLIKKACYLGILALKKGWDEVSAELILKIHNFESKYFTKYFSNLPRGIDPENHNVVGLPHKDQLCRELFRWRMDFDREKLNGVLRIRDDAEAMMYSLIEPIDIDRFTFEVWGSFPEGSPIEEEIELKLVRKRLTSVLKNITTKLIKKSVPKQKSPKKEHKKRKVRKH